MLSKLPRIGSGVGLEVQISTFFHGGSRMRCLWGHLSLLGRGTRGFLIGVFALLISATMAFSQGNTGRILGTVTDQTGGAVVGAAVTVTNVQTGVGRDLVTDN